MATTTPRKVLCVLIAAICFAGSIRPAVSGGVRYTALSRRSLVSSETVHLAIFHLILQYSDFCRASCRPRRREHTVMAPPSAETTKASA